MQPEDRREFNTLLVTAMAVYERQITGALADLYFAALGPYTLQQVRDGMAGHLQDPADGKFSPKPADVIRQIQNGLANDGRLGKDEAWSIALRSLNESDTVLLTEEILTALTAAYPLLELRDKVSARLAFVEAYERQIAMARRGQGSAAKWIVSLGDDKSGRAHAIDEGIRSGRLTHEQAEPHLVRIGQETQRISAEGSAIAGLLAGPAGATPEQLRERWRGVRELITDRGDVLAEKSHRKAMSLRRDTERRKQAVQDQIQGKRASAIIPDEFG